MSSVIINAKNKQVLFKYTVIILSLININCVLTVVSSIGGSHLSATVHRVGGGEEEASAEIGGQSPPEEQDPFQYWAAQLSIFFERKFFEAADRLETLKKSGKNKHFPL